MRTGTKVLIVVGTITALGVGIALASGGGFGMPNGHRPGRRPKDQGKKQDQGGTKWGGDAPPPGWDQLGNLMWISPGCETVLEGARFWPDPPEVDRKIEGKTFDPETALGRVCKIIDTRAIANQPFGCTALDVVDSLIIDQGITDPKEIADRFMSQQSPLCFDVPVEQWPDGFYNYYQDLVERMIDYVEAKRDFLGV